MTTTSNNLQIHDLPTGSYGYSAIDLEDLGATEYTLVTIVQDVSGSVADYKKEMEDCIQEIVGACKLNPRADNLLLRLIQFSDNMDEIHGFKLIAECQISDYDDCLNIGGCTALFESVENAISATDDYSRQLTDNDFDVNGIVVIVTDGMNNRGSSAQKVKDALKKALKEESLESLLTILVGVGVGDYAEVQNYLDEFKNEAELSQYVKIDNANAKELAKLAKFISKSISATSQSLGTGGPSQLLQF